MTDQVLPDAEPGPSSQDAAQGPPPSLERFRAELEVFSGPLDLLLHLIRQEEVDIFDIQLSHITKRYLAAVKCLEFFDVNVAAEFLVMAATLMEIKSRSLLPPADVDDEEDEGDPGTELVRRLLEYKEFKEAAGHLYERGRLQVDKFRRGVPPVHADADAEGEADLLEDLAVWDLMAAFGEILQQTELRRPAEIVRTDIPVAVHMEEVVAALRRAGGSVRFLDFFQHERDKARVIGVFLALLELFRRKQVHIGENRNDPLRIEISLRERDPDDEDD